MKYTIKTLSKYLNLETDTIYKIYNELFNEPTNTDDKMSFNRAFKIINEIEKRGL
jgi:hypothetical protein